MEYGGSGVTEIVLAALTKGIGPMAPVLEIGAGDVSTPYLNQFFELWSIESDEKYCGAVKGVHYIHAPYLDSIKWYDPRAIQEHLGGIASCYAVLVDGPSGRQRDGIINWFHLFPTNVRWVWHNTNYPSVVLSAKRLSERVNRPVTFFTNGDNYAVMEAADAV